MALICKARRLRVGALLVLLLALCTGTARAQQQGETQVVKVGGNYCELNSLHLDYLVQEARAGTERIFVIARLGKKEKSRTLNRTRLDAARFHLILNRDLKEDSVILAEGERTDKEGRLEFYLGSRLYLVSMAAPGKNVCLSCCNDRPDQSGRVR